MEKPSLIGRRIRAYRKEKGITQLQLANEAELTRPFIAQLETGIKKGISVNALRRVAKALGVSLDQLASPYPGEDE